MKGDEALLGFWPDLMGLFGCFDVQFHQYQVVGRALPSESDEHPKIYRMKLWATNEVRAKSKFWYVRYESDICCFGNRVQVLSQGFGLI